MQKILFNEPHLVNHELDYIKKIFHKPLSLNIGYKGYYSKKCSEEIKKELNTKDVFLTGSCTGALEIVAKSINFKNGDEVIIPSFNFVSSVDAFLSNGAKIVFCNIEKNFVIDLKDLKKKITKKTKAIVVVHYNGVSVDFKYLKKIIGKKILIIEDAAQAFGAKYKNKFLGTIGDFGCFSFHESKNIHCGNGGALIVNNRRFLKKISNIWNRGTNREEFDNKLVNKYQWVTEGKSSHMSELQAAFLYAQLKNYKSIIKKRKKLFDKYYLKLDKLQLKNYFLLPRITDYNTSNYHIFYLVLSNRLLRTDFLDYLNRNYIQAVIHYEPLHASKVGKKIYRNKNNELIETFILSKSLVRLPLHEKINDKKINYIVNKIDKYFKFLNKIE
jgi:dTDP-4-amino-4,6-dideoxygalactose transaminase